MAMQIHGNYDHSRTDWAEQRKEKQAAERVERTKETEGAGGDSGRLSEPRDEYISSEKEGRKPAGLYRVEQDGNGNRKLCFDDPKAPQRGGRDGLKAAEDPAGKAGEGNAPGGNQGNPQEKCVGNTDQVDREIRQLKEKKQQLEQQLRRASGDERKTRELEKKRTQIQQELSRKDNDTYRRQHTIFST